MSTKRFFFSSLRGLIWLVLSALLVIGCGTAKVKIHQHVDSDAAYPKTVAVLPFSVNLEIAEGKRPHRILRKVFSNFFSYLGYTDLPLDKVDRKLARLIKTGVNPADLPNDQLRKILETDAVIRGHVIDATNYTGGVYAETSIQAKIELVDLRSGEVLWETEHTELNSSGIAAPGVVDLINEQIENYEIKKAYHKAAESFAVKVLGQVPDPASTRQNSVRLPRIVSIETNIRARNQLKPNDLIYVSLRGDAGLTAYFDIGSFKSYLPMKEVSPGLYTGSYRIQKGDQLGNGALIIGCLKDNQGLTAKKFYKEAMAVIEEARAPTGKNR